jgi:2-keto-4-pentenoate hydratase
MREQMSIASPNHGPLLASMRIEDGVLPMRLRSPRVEPEIAFVMGGSPRGGASTADVLGCVARAVLALEVVDSVWDGYRFDLEHNTADGSSAAGFVLGDELPLDLAHVHVVMTRSGGPDGATEVTDVATGEGTMRAAAESTAWLVDRLADEGRALHAGDVVLSGGLTAATSMGPEPGTRIRAEVALPQGRTAVVELTTGVDGTPPVAV